MRLIHYWFAFLNKEKFHLLRNVLGSEWLIAWSSERIGNCFLGHGGAEKKKFPKPELRRILEMRRRLGAQIIFLPPPPLSKVRLGEKKMVRTGGVP